MNHDEFLEILSAELDGEATRAELASIVERLERDSMARTIRDRYRADRSLLRSWPDELPADRAGRSRAHAARRWAVAAALLLALAAGYFAGRRDHGEPRRRAEATGTRDPLREWTVYPDSNDFFMVTVLPGADPKHLRLK